MDPLKNPFSPGAGAPPPELVGRDSILEEARILLGRIKRKRPFLGSNFFNKGGIVRYCDNGAFKIEKGLLKGFQSHEIEMVRRLVQ